MSLMDWLAPIDRVLNYPLITLSGAPVTPATVITCSAIVFITFKLAYLSQRVITQVLSRGGVIRESTIGVLTRLVRYSIILIGVSVGIDTLGVDLGALFTAGAIFAVGVGFAMQNIAQNFVSGVLILVERAIKPGDVIEVDNTIVQVVDLGIRSTVARTRDDEELIIPNATLAQTTVKNFTMQDSHFRVKTAVGVTYDSDLEVVRRVLEEVAETIDWRLSQYPPLVLLTGFGSSSVDYEVSVWIEQPWRARIYLSRLNEAVWSAFKKEGIRIAFPQLDVHFDPPVSEAFAELRTVS